MSENNLESEKGNSRSEKGNSYSYRAFIKRVNKQHDKNLWHVVESIGIARRNVCKRIAGEEESSTTAELLARIELANEVFGTCNSSKIIADTCAMMEEELGRPIRILESDDTYSSSDTEIDEKY